MIKLIVASCMFVMLSGCYAGVDDRYVITPGYRNNMGIYIEPVYGYHSRHIEERPAEHRDVRKEDDHRNDEHRSEEHKR